MTTDAILAELRALPGAPDMLRERVRALPEPRAAWKLPEIAWRRTLLVLAPAAVALAIGAAALDGVLAGGEKASPPIAVEHGSGAGGALSAQSRAKAAGRRFVPSLALPPSPTRLNKYEAWLRVRVDRDHLASDARRGMQIARSYGGYVASVDMNTPGARGVASLVLRIPVTKVEAAVLRLGKLGDVTAQRVRIQDLQRQANLLRQQILALRTQIAKLEQQLANPNLSTEEHLRLQYQLDDAKRALAQKTNARGNTIREGTLATVSATFFIPQPALAKPHHEGRLGRTFHGAGSFLVRELAWLLYALIVLGPIAVLAAAVVVGVRTARRRGDERLLESS